MPACVLPAPPLLMASQVHGNERCSVSCVQWVCEAVRGADTARVSAAGGVGKGRRPDPQLPHRPLCRLGLACARPQRLRERRRGKIPSQKRGVPRSSFPIPLGRPGLTEGQGHFGSRIRVAAVGSLHLLTRSTYCRRPFKFLPCSVSCSHKPVSFSVVCYQQRAYESSPC